MKGYSSHPNSPEPHNQIHFIVIPRTLVLEEDAVSVFQAPQCSTSDEGFAYSRTEVFPCHCMWMYVHTHTHTHTHIYIYIYKYECW